MNAIKNKCNYIDITEKMIKNKKSIGTVQEQKYYLYNNKKYYVDNHNVVLDYSHKEKEVGKILSTIIGEKVYLIPRINVPEGIKTPDYICKNEHWDLKIIKGKSNRTVEDSIKNCKEQAHNFILDISKVKIIRRKILNQVYNLFNSKTTNWLKKIIVIEDNKIILVLKKIDRNPTGHDQSI